jgi:hypothetical protein
MRPLPRWLLFAALFGGCAPTTAVVNGKTVPLIDMDFYGQPFAVQMTSAHPEPGSPSGGRRGFGGHVSGSVCGLEMTYDVSHLGDHTHLVGFVDNGAFESTIDVRDDGVIGRKIIGRLAEFGGGIDLELRKNHIVGVVGQRQFLLGRRGDQYIGWLKIRQSVTARAVINGADSLWTLPPAAQAVVLPALLTCYGDAIEDRLGDSFQVGFGGRQSWEAQHVSALYHANTMDEKRIYDAQYQGSVQMQTNSIGSAGGLGP